MSKNTFATAINCMDGRVQEPVARFLKERYPVKYVDMITEAGPDGVLAAEKSGSAGSDGAAAGGPGAGTGEEEGNPILRGMREKVGISVYKHGSSVIAVAGHYDCAGNPVAEEVHKEHIKQAVKIVKDWVSGPGSGCGEEEKGGQAIEVIGLWIDENWEVWEVLD